MLKAIKRFWTRSIQRQLIIGIALVHAVLMTIFVFDLVSRQSEFLHQQSVEQAVSHAWTLSANSASWVLANDIIGIEEVIDSQSNYPSLRYAMLVSPDGQVLGHSDTSITGLYVSDSLSQKMLASAPTQQILVENKKIIDVAVPVLANNKLIAWARVGLSQDQNIAGLNVITRDGIIYTVLAIVVGILFAYFMARGLTSGLRQLVKVAHRITEGERHIRSEMEREDEIGELGKDFNKMLDALENNEKALQKAREELIYSEERFDLAMRGSNDGLWDWDAATDKVYFSPRWKEMLGYEVDEISDSEHEWSKRVHPDDLAQAEADIAANLRGETPFYQNEHRIMHKDGHYRWHLERGIAVRDANGHPYRMVGTNTDITDRKLAESLLYEEKERLLVTLNSIGDAVITTDELGNVLFMNPVAEQITGWLTQEVYNKPIDSIFNIINEDTGEAAANPVNYCLVEGSVTGIPSNTLLINRYGHEVAIEDSAAPIKDQHGQIIGVIIVFHDVTQARELSQQLSWQATHDSLTNLYNRAELERILEETLHDAKLNHTTHALMYIDLDQFKVVNDTCGHVAGDELLRQLSFILQDHVRHNDILARLGGDEFGLLLIDCPIAQATTIANNIRQVIKEFRFSWEDKTFEIGASIGLVEINELNHNLSSVLSAADVACYAAKDLGRNRVHLYEPEDEDLQQRRGEMQWLAHINQAIAENNFVLYCQGIQNTLPDNQAEEHYEILIRMLDSEDKIIPPGVFIPAAERYNLMPAIDRWVIKNLFQRIAKHIDLSGRRPEYGFAVNLSGNTFSDVSFLDYVMEMFNEYTIPYEMITFEITETAAIANLTQANRFIRKMKKLGCHFALDDFGSGLSSFAYLKNLPVDYLKIDGTFVKDLLDDPIDRAMVKSIHDVGHVMGIQTIAEFVESDAIRQELGKIGVDYVQGFGIEKPEPLSEKHLLGGSASEQHTQRLLNL